MKSPIPICINCSYLPVCKDYPKNQCPIFTTIKEKKLITLRHNYEEAKIDQELTNRHKKGKTPYKDTLQKRNKTYNPQKTHTKTGEPT